VARQSPDRPNADDLDESVSDLDLWQDVRVDPVQIALPTGVGYTLRAYRPAAEVTYSAARRRGGEEIDDLDEADDVRDDDLEDDADDDAVARRTGGDEARAEDGLDEAEEPDLDDETDAGDEDAGDEEVPVFLAHAGRLYLFRTEQGLVEFVRSAEPHDLTQLDTWAELVDRIRPEDVAPSEEDTYELDLVVENLRGGHDVWSPELIISAGEIARDLGYALRIEPILAALAPGSPLDDLDEALRAMASGGLSGFVGRRRVRKIGAQQATLGWRTIIGKISGVVDWRE
jgi:hypothetical protein